MCTACVLPKDASITEEEFDNMWQSNEDGAGFAFINEKGELETRHSMKLDDIKKEWKELHALHSKYTPFLLHFRASSQGKVDVDNCHPFLPNPKTAFIHNGTIKSMPIDKDGRSDSRLFSEDWLARLPHNFTKNFVIIRFMEEYVGASNKLAFLNTDGETLIVNKSGWTEHNNVLFSNTFFQSKRSRTETKNDPTGTSSNVGGVSNVGVGVSGKTSTVHSQHGYSQTSKYTWCQGCLRSVDRFLEFNFQKGVCVSCTEEIELIAKGCRISEWKAKEIFLEAYVNHKSTEFYEKYADHQISTIKEGIIVEEPKLLVAGKEEMSFHPDKPEKLTDAEKARIARLATKKIHELTHEEYSFMIERGAFIGLC